MVLGALVVGPGALVVGYPRLAIVGDRSAVGPARAWARASAVDTVSGVSTSEPPRGQVADVRPMVVFFSAMKPAAEGEALRMAEMRLRGLC